MYNVNANRASENESLLLISLKSALAVVKDRFAGVAEPGQSRAAPLDARDLRSPYGNSWLAFGYPVS